MSYHFFTLKYEQKRRLKLCTYGSNLLCILLVKPCSILETEIVSPRERLESKYYCFVLSAQLIMQRVRRRRTPQMFLDEPDGKSVQRFRGNRI